MQRGRRAIPAHEKTARGTFRPDRDAQKVQLVVDNNGPIMPEHMLLDEDPLVVIARHIWNDLHPKVTALGVAECDSSLFARYCLLEAHCRASFARGVIPRVDQLTALRQMEEMLRIAGPKSRVIGGAAVSGGSNPFKDNGRRKRG